MKSKVITTIILEGADGVGKDTVFLKMRNQWSKHYGIYVRGELSNYVYSKKYNRPFISTQRNAPIIYVVLYADETVLEARIRARATDVEDELDKLGDQKLFMNAVKQLKQDYHIIELDTTNKTPDQVANEVYALVNEYCKKYCEKDPEINNYNKMYKKGCDKLGLDFFVKNNQPYIDGQTIMADAQLHNGSYETFSDKRMPHNFIFSLGYDEFYGNSGIFDFCYIISSKINVRPEVNDYFEAFKNAGLTCLTRQTYTDKVFGDEYIKRIAEAKATVYCCRDLAYLKMITVRPYEAALANQILFVDEQTDPENEILTQIHRNTALAQYLRVTPDTIAEKYRMLDNKTIDTILRNQRIWYLNLKEQIFKAFKRS